MREFYWKMRARLLAAGLWPQGWIARGACYSLNLAIGLFVLKLLLNLWAPAVSESLGGWIKFLIFDAALLFSILAFRRLKQRVLWRWGTPHIVNKVFI
jgi:hypothetical protein